ncbi:hypothetical protein SFRURICE_005872 [Spodoptera frugiperda]|nr:hypothetical protein SFRURICE_005872 [Spodoptera frugiperda]
MHMSRNNNLWITQRVVLCGNRTRYTLHGSQLTSHRANRAAISIVVITLYTYICHLILSFSHIIRPETTIFESWNLLHEARQPVAQSPYQPCS